MVPLVGLFVDDGRSFGDLSVLEASAYEKFNAHIKGAYWRSSRRRPSRMMERVVLTERPQRGKRHTTCTKLGKIEQSVLHRRSCKRVEEGD